MSGTWADPATYLLAGGVIVLEQLGADQLLDAALNARRAGPRHWPRPPSRTACRRRLSVYTFTVPRGFTQVPTCDAGCGRQRHRPELPTPRRAAALPMPMPARILAKRISETPSVFQCRSFGPARCRRVRNLIFGNVGDCRVGVSLRCIGIMVKHIIPPGSATRRTWAGEASD